MMSDTQTPNMRSVSSIRAHQGTLQGRAGRRRRPGRRRQAARVHHVDEAPQAGLAAGLPVYLHCRAGVIGQSRRSWCRAGLAPRHQVHQRSPPDVTAGFWGFDKRTAGLAAGALLTSAAKQTR